MTKSPARGYRSWHDQENTDIMSQAEHRHGSAERTTERIVATGTLLVELKFHRGCGSVGHIEDVVVDAAYRGSKLGLR